MSHMFDIDEVNVPDMLNLPVGKSRQPGQSIQSPHPSAKQKKLRFTNVKTFYVYAHQEICMVSLITFIVY